MAAHSDHELVAEPRRAPRARGRGGGRRAEPGVALPPPWARPGRRSCARVAAVAAHDRPGQATTGPRRSRRPGSSSRSSAAPASRPPRGSPVPPKSATGAMLRRSGACYGSLRPPSRSGFARAHSAAARAGIGGAPAPAATAGTAAGAAEAEVPDQAGQVGPLEPEEPRGLRPVPARAAEGGRRSGPRLNSSTQAWYARAASRTALAGRGGLPDLRRQVLAT